MQPTSQRSENRSRVISSRNRQQSQIQQGHEASEGTLPIRIKFQHRYIKHRVHRQQNQGRQMAQTYSVKSLSEESQLGV